MSKEKSQNARDTARLVFEIDVCELMPVVVAHNGSTRAILQRTRAAGSGAVGGIASIVGERAASGAQARAFFMRQS